MAKKGLGKGLGYLMAEAGAETAAAKTESDVKLEDIIVNPNQPRKKFEKKELDALADSIKQNGIIQPLLVRKKDNKYEIVAGERRYQAARKLGLEKVPVIIKNVSDEDLFAIALIENLQREDLSPLEEAHAYKTLMQQKSLTQEELAKLVSKSRPAIANTLRLLDLPDSVKELVEDGSISAGHARAVLLVKEETGQIKLAQKAAEEKLSVRKIEQLAPLYSHLYEASKIPRTKTPPDYKTAAKKLRNCLGTKVRVRDVRGKHRIEIDFTDTDQLKHLVNYMEQAYHSGLEQQQ